MPRGLNNWTAAMVMRFLKKHGFIHAHSRGSHLLYAKKGATRSFLVTIPFHAAKAIHPKTMKSIVVQSGIPLSEWK